MATIKQSRDTADVPPQAVRGEHMKIQYVTSLSSTTNPKPKGQPCSVLPRTIWGDQF